MNRIIDFVSGKLTYAEFEVLFTADPSLWDIAQTLLTPEILNDNTHPFWSKSNRSRLESNHYSVQYACLSFGYDAVGKVVTHRMLGELVSYHYPDVVPRDPPEFSGKDLRDKLGMAYLGGIEVDGIINEVLAKKQEDTAVAKFINAAKQELRTRFHLGPRKYPHWIQEPEWPMGKHSPMLYVTQRSNGELVEFIFQDIDTEEQRIIKQYY